MELVIFVGLQASGKSTFFRERFAATHAHVSKDLFRNNRDRNRRQAQLIEAALGKGVSVVVDNTNPTVEDRMSLIRLGRRFGAEIVGYYFDSTVRQSIGRNRQRAGADRAPCLPGGVRRALQRAHDRRFHLRCPGGASRLSTS